MTTETITLSKDATLAMLFKKIANKNKKYVVSIDGTTAFEINVDIATKDRLRAEQWRKENDEAVKF
jgi:post-segregation antitoxin (ccd killing protein)